MDEAGRLITELQQKLAQLDHKVWLYRQDMASEFRKHADSLLRDVPEEVSDTVNKAVNESLKGYPSLDLGLQDTDMLRGAVNSETSVNWSSDNISTQSETVMVPTGLYDGPESPLDEPRNLHEREQEFQGLFTPSYLPLLDSTDRNERRSSASSASPSSSEIKLISIISQEKSVEEPSPTSSSYPPSSSLQLYKLPTPRRRNTDDTSTKSDQSDTPVRRSALRRTSSSSKPQSPRHVRFEFAGEQFPTTSSPSVGLPELEIGAGYFESSTGLKNSAEAMESPQEEIQPESPPPKKVSSSQALRALSRGPIEDDGTKWTEVIAPFDGSASVPRGEGDKVDSDEESLSMRPLSITGRPARSNGHKKRNSGELKSSDSGAIEPQSGEVSKSTEESSLTSNGEKTPTEVAEEEGILADVAPLQSMRVNRPTETMSAETLEEKYADKSQTSATRGRQRPFFVLPDGTDLIDYSGSTAKINVDDDDDDLFDFDENTERSHQRPSNEPDSDSEWPASDHGDEDLSNFAAYATSPARPILKPGTPIGTSNRTASSSSHRSSYHPFQTPIVSEAIHAQAASLGNVASFVGSVKNGLDEMHLQSFRGGSSLRGAAPMSLSERMAFEEAMEAQHETARKR